MRESTRFLMLARPYSTSALATKSLSDLLTKLESLSQAPIQDRIKIANASKDAIEANCNINHIPTMLHDLNRVRELVRGTPHTAMDPQIQKQFDALRLMISYAQKNLERQLRDHRDNGVTPPRILFRHQ